MDVGLPKADNVFVSQNRLKERSHQVNKLARMVCKVLRERENSVALIPYHYYPISLIVYDG